MRRHPLRKFMGLLTITAVVIIGIFVVQFKALSVITKSIGPLHVSIYQTENESHQMVLRNQFEAEYKGLIFYCKEESPVTSIDKSGKESPLLLSKWNIEKKELSFTFSDGSILSFNTDKNDDAIFTVKTELASDTKSISVPYKFSGTTKIDSSNLSKILIFEKKEGFAFTAPSIDSSRIKFTSAAPKAIAAVYNPVQKFTFAQVAGLKGSEPSAYNTTIKNIRAAAVTKIAAALETAPDSVTEQEIAVYVAEMASQNRFNDAIDTIPAAFKTGTKRTYYTAPFFNNLATMNSSLDMQTSNLKSMTDNAILSKNLDIFTIDGIADFILREKKTARIKNLLSMAASTTAPSVTQAAAVLNIYSRVYSESPETVSVLTELTERCADIIESNCTLTNDTIVINGKSPSDKTGYIAAGSALIEAGQINGKTSWCDTGRLLVNNALASYTSLDFHVIASAYQILIRDNTYFPHTLILGYYGNSPVWAWTCANSITYSIDEENIVNINIDFPLSFSHYIFFKGIPTFHSQIEIQSQMFRSDSRFETYNSSGYVYLADTETLLIKSRHKSPRELIRLFCDPASNFSR